ncbi:hypothetical protein Tco_1233996 [Tanacetum coccineum]
MLEIYHGVTGAIFTTLASVQKNVAIANGGVTKQEIVGSQSRERNKGSPSGSGKKLKYLLFMVWESRTLQENVLIVEVSDCVNLLQKRNNCVETLARPSALMS